MVIRISSSIPSLFDSSNMAFSSKKIHSVQFVSFWTIKQDMVKIEKFWQILHLFEDGGSYHCLKNIGGYYIAKELAFYKTNQF